MEKKGEGKTWAIILGIIAFLVITVIIVSLIIINSNIKSKETTQEIELLSLYIDSKDSETLSQLGGHYVILDKIGIISEGELNKDSLLEIGKINKNQSLEIYCWSNGYYSSRLERNFTETEKLYNTSRITCFQDKSGSLDIDITGGIQLEDNQISIRLNSQKHFKGLSAVLFWSSGIIDIDFQDNFKSCNETWVNYSYLDIENEVIKYLPENHYFCGEEIETCLNISNNQCLLTDKIPERFKDSYIIINTGKSLSPGETYALNLNVKTRAIKNKDDFLEIIFYDRDLRLIEGQIAYLNDKEIGNPTDFKVRINYEE